MLKRKNDFKLATMKPESDIIVPPRTDKASEMYVKLDELKVKQSYKMPMAFRNQFTNARLTHKRHSNKVFIYRTIDKFNFRVWRVEDGKALRTSRS